MQTEVYAKKMLEKDEEIVETLVAISVVSKRLAKKLAKLNAQKRTKGGKYPIEQDERVVRGSYRTTQVR